MGRYERERRASEEKMSGVWEGTARDQTPRFRALSLFFFFARRWFRSLPPIESLEQANVYVVKNICAIAELRKLK